MARNISTVQEGKEDMMKRIVGMLRGAQSQVKVAIWII